MLWNRVAIGEGDEMDDKVDNNVDHNVDEESKDDVLDRV